MYGTQEQEFLTAEQKIYPNVRYCYNVNYFMNLFNKELKLSLPFPIFCLGVTVLFLFIYILLVTFLYQKRFYCYTFDSEFSLYQGFQLRQLQFKSKFTYLIR